MNSTTMGVLNEQTAFTFYSFIFGFAGTNNGGLSNEHRSSELKAFRTKGLLDYIERFG